MPYQNYFNPYQMPIQQQQQQSMQSANFVTVRSEDEARNYPVAPGNSITFFNETQPYCYKKTMSFSPLDHPTFERYKIVKEEAPNSAQIEPKALQPMENTTNEIKAEIEAIKRDIEALKEKVNKTGRSVKKNDAEPE